MTSSQRMLVNMIATYGRTVLSVLLSIIASRWVLHALGASDYGLFNVVGSIIVFITFLNGVLSTSSVRHFSYSMGRRDMVETNRWFNTSLSIHFFLPLVLLSLGYPLGVYYINNIMTIPVGRNHACISVFTMACVAAFSSMASVPFCAMFTAKQRITELAIWGVLQSLCSFGCAFVLSIVSGDRLVFYAFYGMAINVIVNIAMSIRAWWIFEECQIHKSEWFDRVRMKEICSFAGWQLFGCIGSISKAQGSAVLLNAYFPATINAAFGIANIVAAQTMGLASSLLGAFSPEIIAAEGAGNRTRMLDLSMSVCKFATFLVLIFAIPLMVEIDYVLKLWLVDVPDYTAVFCRSVMGIFIVDMLTVGYMTAVNAHGRVAGYQLTLGSLLILIVPIAWIMLKCGFGAVWVAYIAVLMQFVCTIGRVVWGKILLGISPRLWIREVFIPILSLSTISFLFMMLLINFMNPSFPRLVLTTCLSVLLMSGGSFLWIWNKREKEFILSQFFKVIDRLKILRQS